MAADSHDLIDQDHRLEQQHQNPEKLDQSQKTGEKLGDRQEKVSGQQALKTERIIGTLASARIHASCEKEDQQKTGTGLKQQKQECPRICTDKEPCKAAE